MLRCVDTRIRRREREKPIRAEGSEEPFGPHRIH